jgi:hypothetical protein
MNILLGTIGIIVLAILSIMAWVKAVRKDLKNDCYQRDREGLRRNYENLH